MTKKYFTQEQLAALKPAEEYFNTVVNSHYKRASYKELNDLVADLYEEVTGEKLARNWSCGTCVITAFEKAGKLYYESLEHYRLRDEQLEFDFEQKDHTEMIAETMQILDLNVDGTQIEPDGEDGMPHGIPIEELEKVQKGTEPDPEKKETEKKVANKTKGRPKKK